MWTYRDLLFFLVWREIKVRYQQTFIGAGWAVLQPLATVLIFTIFFGRLVKISSDGVPYSLFSLSGIVLWNLYSNGLTQISNSLVTSAGLLTKVYFPRMVIPLAAVMAGLLDFLIGCSVLLVMMIVNGQAFQAQTLAAPLFFLLACVFTFSVGLWLAAINIKYRDIRHIVPFLIQFGMFATPVIYPSSLLKGIWRDIYVLNPMAVAIEGLRWSLFGTGLQPGWNMVPAFLLTLFLLISGCVYFFRSEHRFADLV